MKVTKETYDFVFKRDHGECIFCGDPRIELHHINGRSDKRTNDTSNCVMLCRAHHKMVQGQKMWGVILRYYTKTGILDLTLGQHMTAYEAKIKELI